MFFLERDRPVQNILMLRTQTYLRDSRYQIAFHAEHLGGIRGNPRTALDAYAKILSSQPVAPEARRAFGFLRKVDLPGLLIALMGAPLAPHIEISGIVGMKYKDHRDGAQRRHVLWKDFVRSAAVAVFLDIEDTRLHFLDGYQIIEFDSFGAHGHTEFVHRFIPQSFPLRIPHHLTSEFH